MNQHDATRIRAISDAYRFTGMFLSLPSIEVAQEIVSGNAAAYLETILLEIGVDELRARAIAAIMNKGNGESAQEEHHALRRDFTRLFTNPERPRVNVYESGFKKADDFDTSQLAFISPTAIDAERQYKAWGLEVGGEHRESPDHMGAEVDFLGFLYGTYADALEKGDSESAGKAARSIDEFKRTHFDKWGAGFFAAVLESAQTSAYRAVGELGLTLALL